MNADEEKSKPGILRWWERIAIALGVVIIFLIILVIIGAIIGSDSNDDHVTSDIDPTLRMAAHVHVLPGAVKVINNNEFPWHGLIITINDDFSTRYRMNDPNYYAMRPERMIQPDEEVSPSLEFYSDKSGKEFEGILYTVTIKNVELEARSRPDGPYDLSLEISTTDANATPTPVRRATIRVYPSGSGIAFESIWVEHHEPEYDEVLTFVSEYPQNDFGSYMLPTDAYHEVQALLGQEPSDTGQNKTERWQEQWHHWENIDAFKASMESTMTDRVIDEEETEHICFVLDQWVAQMTDAQNYVEDYKKDDPKILLNSGLGNLEDEAERALELLSKVECE